MTAIDLPKNSKETLRIARETFKGHELINVRVFYEAEDGSLRPTKKGVSLRVDMLADVIEALQALSKVSNLKASKVGESRPEPEPAE